MSRLSPNQAEGIRKLVAWLAVGIAYCLLGCLIIIRKFTSLARSSGPA